MLDVIGDIHGCYEELHSLFEKLGWVYDDDNHFFYHPTRRKAVFIGDIIDGGPDNIKSIRLVQNMVDRDYAHILNGNHEFNAVMWDTPDPQNPDEFCRPHRDNNYKQHASYLFEVSKNRDLHNEMTAWFKTLPLYLEIGNAKFAHACWSQNAIDFLNDHAFLTDKGALNDKGWAAAMDESSKAYKMIELLLKGPEENLPDGQSYPDVLGMKRIRARVSWWNENPITNGDAYSSIPECHFLKQSFNGAGRESLRGGITQELKNMRKGEVIFFGHISRMDDPAPLSDKIICVDYGIKKGKQIVAWRMHDVMEPARGHFVSVEGKTLRKPQLKRAIA